ncbi:MAG: DASS family sodium-coupled anion symporter [Bacteroidetes bacterium]|nr:DASS family sodium-coupled anion symporter [Bacteroidota bacterium]
MHKNKSLKIISGPLAAIIVWLFFDLDATNVNVTLMAGIALWISIWWLTEAIHLSVTALIPLLLIPMLGLADVRIIASQYMDSIIFLFIGGFILAIAIEKWGLHNYFARFVLSKTGTTPSKILLGVMIASFVISMWVSNTATVLMLLATVIAIVGKLKVEDETNTDAIKKITTALLIGLAYSASIGGMCTLVGTPTNMIFYKEFTKLYTTQYEMNFFVWFKYAFPIALILLLAAFSVLYILFIRKVRHVKITFHDFRLEKRMSKNQKVVSIIFICTVLLWFTRSTIDFGFVKFYGWSNWFKMPNYIDDSVVAILMAVLLFLIPASSKLEALMTWDDAQKIPFDIVLLFGGGFALAKGFEVSGLSNWIASHLHVYSQSSLFLFVFIVVVLTCVISEFASNVACIQLMLPILNAVIINTTISPMVILVPATLAASLGFVMPVATAPNTIVYGTKLVRTIDMAHAGFWVDVIGIILISCSAFFML